VTVPELPPGFVALPVDKGCLCVIPERVYVAGLRLGKQLRRMEATRRRQAACPPGQGRVQEEDP